MTILLEQPVPILIVGLLAAAAAGVAFVSTGRLPFGLATLALLALTGVLLALEWFVETDREQVEHSIYDTATAIQANDAPTVLSRISQLSPQVRSQAEQELARYTIAGFKINDLDIMVKSDHKPPLATAIIACMATGRFKGESPPNHSVPAELTLNMRREDDGVWRVTSYKARLGLSGFGGRRGDDEIRSPE